MQDPLITSVIETDFEAEALFYEGMLHEFGLYAQVRPIVDPLLANVVRQIVLPRYQVVVPNEEAATAEHIIAQERQTEADTVPVEEEQAGETNISRTALLLLGRLFIWMLLIMSIMSLFRLVFLLQAHHP